MQNEQFIYEQIKNANITVTSDSETNIKAILKLDEQIEKICQKYGIFSEFKKIYNMIYDTYHGIKDIKTSVIDDIDREGENEICFEINIKRSMVDRVVEDEKRFYAHLIKEIPERENQHFRFTFRFVEP